MSRPQGTMLPVEEPSRFTAPTTDLPNRTGTPIRRRSRKRNRGGWPRVPARWQIVAPAGGGSSVAHRFAAGTPLCAAYSSVRVDRAAVRRAPLRLTVRGRVVICLGILVVIVGSFLAGRTAGASAQAVSSVPSTMVVQPGQTLWQIAGEIAPGVDRRATVASLLRRNPRVAADVHPGQILLLPAR